ncbi:MAG: hypothetical protein FDZ75_09430 [Actinobacteria bacterium]|nr:MAG: hypothetical protein FDZ75_09430 [Actinomycetota bacterium]
MTDMDQPLGMAVGNSLEVREAIAVLRNEGPKELTEVSLILGAKMLVLGGKAADETEARGLLQAALALGSGLNKFREWVAAQGGNPRIADDPDLLPLSHATRVVASPRAGYIAGYDAERVGRAAMLLGAGRARKDDVIDPGAGLVLVKRAGERVEAGEPLATLYAAVEGMLDSGESRFLSAVRFSDTPVEAPPLVHHL